MSDESWLDEDADIQMSDLVAFNGAQAFGIDAVEPLEDRLEMSLCGSDCCSNCCFGKCKK